MSIRPALLGAALALIPARATPPPEPRTFLEAAPGPSAFTTFAACVEALEQWAGPELPDWLVHSAAFTYSARRPRYDPAGAPVLDAGGQPACDPVSQSGRIFYPPTWRVPFGRELPLVVYAHFTSLRKDEVPSNFGGHEWLFGAAAALYYGFAVAMPDLPGMGLDRRDYHPFCHAESLAYSALDGIPAMRAVNRQDPWLVAGGYGWDGRVFVLGYSEGAYTALAAARDFARNEAGYQARGIDLTGAVCMAGPYDLSGLGRAGVVWPSAGHAFDFLMPYLVVGWHAIYGPRVDPRAAFAPALLEARDDGMILDWMDGSLDAFAMGDRVARRLGRPRDQVTFRDLLDPEWMARELDDPGYATGSLRPLLEANDLHRGWTPNRPILFCHSPADADVPFQQSVAAMGWLGAELLKAGREPGQRLRLIPIGGGPPGLGHLAAIAFALPTGFRWIYDGMPMGTSPGVGSGIP